MNLIAAVDNNWAIGYQNSLLVRIPRDQQMFREMTEGKVIVVGRKTFETFPQKQPLKNRVNIILTRDAKYSVKGAVTVHSIEELMEELQKYDPKDIYVAGGASVYAQLTATPRTLQRLTMPIRQMRTVRGWTRWQTGNAPRRARSRLILTSSTIFAAMNGLGNPKFFDEKILSEMLTFAR